MRHHYTSFPPPRPYSPPPRPYSPPPPPPPPPPDIVDPNAADAARCYFCGHRVEESQIARTNYDVGHGHKIIVTICPACTKKKERGEGPFSFQISGQHVLGILGLIIAAIFFFGFWLPGWLEMGREHERMKKRHEEFNRKFDEDWGKRFDR